MNDELVGKYKFQRSPESKTGLKRNSTSGKTEWSHDNKSHIFALVEDVRLTQRSLTWSARHAVFHATSFRNLSKWTYKSIHVLHKYGTPKAKYMVTSTHEHRRNVGDLLIGNKTFEVVQSLQYLGNITSNANNNKCIKERMMMCNKVYYANRQLFNSILISRNSKLQIYRTLVRPVVTYGSKSLTLTMEEERALAVFERKTLRKIHGPVKENELWRIRRND